jgi:phosphatidylglycerol:prolipoprotein diacylglycerol transferase
VAGPLFPYIEAPELPLAFLKYIPLISSYIDPNDPPSIKPFGTLVALGVYIGTAITMNRVKERKLDGKQVSDFIFWTVAAGFVISHLFDAITYHPDTVAKDPMYLLRIWDGLSSYGGLLGAICGSLAWGYRYKKRVLEYMDLCVSAFPTAWVFGRAGCASVHDHPGALSNAWYAVKFPPHTLQAGFEGRYDLGLIEMFLTIPLALACHILWRRNPYRANGFYIGLTLTCYAPVRFILDFLRVTPEDQVFRGAIDPRYFGLTPAQWICFLAIATGIFFLARTWKAKYVRLGDLAPPEDAPSDEDAGDDDEPESDRPRKKKKLAVEEPAAQRPVGTEKKKKKKAPVTGGKKAPAG